MSGVVVADPQRVLDEVFAKVSRVVSEPGARDDAALAITVAYLTEVGPAWSMRAADQARMDVLTCLEMVRRGHSRGPAAAAELDPVAPPPV